MNTHDKLMLYTSSDVVLLDYCMDGYGSQITVKALILVFCCTLHTMGYSIKAQVVV